MKKIILAAFMAACGLQMSAQQNLFVAQDLESAIVNKDNTVTFNFKAPDAQKVQIAGDFAEKAEGQHIGGMVEQFDRHDKEFRRNLDLYYQAVGFRTL